MTAADVGNYHFGYVGKYVNGGKGFSNYILWKGAGYAEAGKEWKDGNKFIAILRYNSLLTPISRRSGDRKADFKWSTKGMNDAKRKKR